MSVQGWLFPEEAEDTAAAVEETAGRHVADAGGAAVEHGEGGLRESRAAGSGPPAENPSAPTQGKLGKRRGRPPADNLSAPSDIQLQAPAPASAARANNEGNSRSKPRGAKRAAPEPSPAPWEDAIPQAAPAPVDGSTCAPWEESPRQASPGEEPQAAQPDDLTGPTQLESESPAEAEQVLSVTELTARIKEVLELRFPCVWVAGEIGDLSRPQSGHCYLVLKDAQSQIAAVIWRSTASRLKFDLHDGLEVVCRGRIEVYGPRGKYQLVIDQIEPRGIGALELALRQLRERLQREGLFDKRYKRPLPKFVRQIAVVTSPSGAALCDFLEVLRRRWAGADVLVLPVRVQGEGAAEEIAAALALVNRLRRPIDCVALIRGGGSLEDLWAFNEEVVVRAIRQSRIPVVSGVGHEIDVTLSDLAADVRALTPSEAAERIVPSAEEMAARLAQLRQRMLAALRNRVLASRRRVEMLAGRPVFRWPLARVQQWARRLDELEDRSHRAMRGRLERAQARIEALAGRLETLSPLAVLGRGYSLTQRESDGRIVRDPADVPVGQRIITRLASGQITSRVEP